MLVFKLPKLLNFRLVIELHLCSLSTISQLKPSLARRDLTIARKSLEKQSRRQKTTKTKAEKLPHFCAPFLRQSILTLFTFILCFILCFFGLLCLFSWCIQIGASIYSLRLVCSSSNRILLSKNYKRKQTSRHTKYQASATKNRRRHKLRVLRKLCLRIALFELVFWLSFVSLLFVR